MIAPLYDRTAAQCAIASALAQRLRQSRQMLAERWVQSIIEHDSFDPPRPPSREMTDDMPLLIDGIAWHLEHPDDCLSADTPVIRKAMQIGKLRHAQGYTAKDILQEYELLGRLLFDYLANALADADPLAAQGSALVCGSLLFHAIVVIEITTTTHYLQIANEHVAEREERLRAFNRAVSHEIKNRIGTLMSAGGLLADKTVSPEQQHRLGTIISRNAREMTATVENLLVLARIEDDPREHRRVSLRTAVDEVIEAEQPFAESAHVSLDVLGDLPDVEVDDVVMHLSLVNYIRNAIKYADMHAKQRFVHIDASIRQGDNGNELVVHVADNGIGVPADKRAQLFHRFFRAHDRTHHEGTGLGLSIVRASVASIGGRAWAEFPGQGSVFAIAVPVPSPPPFEKVVEKH